MSPGTQTVEDLGRLVKAKYPQYAKLSDVELGQKVKAKYPAYSKFADMPQGAEKTGLPTPGRFMPPPPQMSAWGPTERSLKAEEEQKAEQDKVDKMSPDEKKAALLEYGLQCAGLLGIAADPMGAAAGALAGGAAKYGAKKLGVPEAGQDIIGLIAGLYGGFRGGRLGGKERLLKDAGHLKEVPEVRAALSEIWTKKGLGGWNKLEKAIETAQREASEPRISAFERMKTSPAKKVLPAPEAEAPALQPQKEIEVTPYPKGKGTGTPFGGPYEKELQAGKPPSRASRALPSPLEKASGEAPGEAPKAPGLSEDEASEYQRKIGGPRAAKVARLAPKEQEILDLLKANGISKEAAAKAPPDLIAKVAKAVGEKRGISAITWKRIVAGWGSTK